MPERSLDVERTCEAVPAHALVSTATTSSYPYNSGFLEKARARARTTSVAWDPTRGRLTAELVAVPQFRLAKAALVLSPKFRCGGRDQIRCLSCGMCAVVLLGIACTIGGGANPIKYNNKENGTKIWHPFFSWSLSLSMILLCLVMMHFQHIGLVHYCFRQISVWVLLTMHAGACIFTLHENVIVSRMLFYDPGLAIHDICVNVIIFASFAYLSATLDAVQLTFRAKRRSLIGLAMLEVTYYAVTRSCVLVEREHGTLWLGMTSQDALLYCMSYSLVLILYMLLSTFWGRYFVVLFPRWDVEDSASYETSSTLIPDLVTTMGHRRTHHNEEESILLIAYPPKHTADGTPILRWKSHHWLFERGCLPVVLILCVMTTFGIRQVPLLLQAYVFDEPPNSHLPYQAQHVCQWSSALCIWLGNTCIMHRQNQNLVWMCLCSGRAQLLLLYHVAAGIAAVYSFQTHTILLDKPLSFFSYLVAEILFRSGLAYAFGTVDAMQISGGHKICVVAFCVLFNIFEYLMVAVVDDLIAPAPWDTQLTSWWWYPTTPQKILLSSFANAGVVLAAMLASLVMGRPFSVLHARWKLVPRTGEAAIDTMSALER